MIVDLQLLSEERVHRETFALSLSDPEMPGLPQWGTAFRDPVPVEAVFLKEDGALSLTLRLSYQGCFPCDRCLTETTVAGSLTFRHVLRDRDSEDPEEDLAFFVKDRKLDLDALATADLLSRLPTKILCDPDCKGLCPTCGKNLNEGGCDCEGEGGDPRWAALRQLLE